MANSDNIQVAGTLKNPLSPAQKARVKAFLDTVPAKVLPSAVIVLRPDEFKKFAQSGAASSRTARPEDRGQSEWAFSDGITRRVYLNGAAFGEKHPNYNYQGTQFPEFLIGHEISHMNDSLDPREQERFEIQAVRSGQPNPYDVKSRDLLKKWQQQGGEAYSALKQQAPANAGTVQPEPTQIKTTVDDPAETAGNKAVSSNSASPDDQWTNGFVSEGAKQFARKQQILNSYPDRVEGILRVDENLADPHKESLWDLFHATRSANELAGHLQPLSVSPETKNRLYHAKLQQDDERAADPVSHVRNAFTKLGEMDPQILELAEKYPTSARALINAAQG